MEPMINEINRSAVEEEKSPVMYTEPWWTVVCARGSGRLPERLVYVILRGGEHVSRNVDYRSVASAFGCDNIERIDDNIGVTRSALPRPKNIRFSISCENFARWSSRWFYRWKKRSPRRIQSVFPERPGGRRFCSPIRTHDRFRANISRIERINDNEFADAHEDAVT